MEVEGSSPSGSAIDFNFFIKKQKKGKNELSLDNKNTFAKSCYIFFDFDSNIHTNFNINILKNL